MSGIEEMGDSEDGRMLNGQSPAVPGSESPSPNRSDLQVGVLTVTLDEEKSAPPQVGFQFAGGGDDAARLGTDYDVLSPALQDCWPVVFDNLSDPQTWSAVSNTCIFFHYLMKSRMAELAIPILLRNVKLERPIILALRQASKQSKAVVDELLLESKPEWLTERFFLWNPEDMQKFGRDFTPALQGTLASEFLTLRIEHPAQFKSALEFVTNHGETIRGIRLSLDVERLPVVYERLTALLPQLPNLDNLKLFFEESENVDDDSGPDQLNPKMLPELRLLKNLRLSFEDRFFATNRLAVFVQRYGLQLDKFECSARAFSQMRPEICTNFLSNLLQLKVSKMCNGNRNQVFAQLATVQLPKLETLILEGIVFETSADFLSAVSNFRASLKVLDISKLKLEMVNVELNNSQLADLKQCPKMETLVLYVSSDIHTSLAMKAFGIMFINLRSLTFAGRWNWRRGSDNNSGKPFWFWRRKYYSMWPRLEKIRNKVGGGPNWFGREKIFTRPRVL